MCVAQPLQQDVANIGCGGYLAKHMSLVQNRKSLFIFTLLWWLKNYLLVIGFLLFAAKQDFTLFLYARFSLFIIGTK
jgi:hypothetical protein